MFSNVFFSDNYPKKLDGRAQIYNRAWAEDREWVEDGTQLRRAALAAVRTGTSNQLLSYLIGGGGNKTKENKSRQQALLMTRSLAHVCLNHKR